MLAWYCLLSRDIRGFFVSLVLLLSSLNLNIVFAAFSGGGPKPGDIYREFAFRNDRDNWRVTDVMVAMIFTAK